MTPPDNVSWTEANQTFLVTEFARLKTRLGEKPETPSVATPPSPALPPESPPAIDWLAKVFGLTSFERDIVLLCAGVEMDSRVAALCGEALARGQRTYATFGLALAVLAEPHWSALAPTRPLRRFRLVEVEAGQGLTAAPLRLDERILHLLAGINIVDPRLDRLARFCPPTQYIAREHAVVTGQVIRAWETQRGPLPVCQLCGDDDSGQEDVAAQVAQHAGRKLLVLVGEDIPANGPDGEHLEMLWSREALLLPGALLVQTASGTVNAAARRWLERLPGMVFLAGREPVRLERASVRFEVNKPSPAGQKELWEQALGAAAVQINGDVDNLSAQFRLSARAIFSTSNLIGSDAGEERGRELWKGCRALARPRLEDLAQRIQPAAGWDDLILPETRKQTLRQIVAQVRHRLQVYETWGFSAQGRRGLGVSALFTGESGTGKTMAAEVLARELELDLYRIDLSAVVSKYIGETEKNLKRVFDAAEEGGVILLFDEADALFGKRSEVKDSHDRFANIEVSYLLQRIEAYQGLAILTTNLKSSMDRAFQRRIRFIVNFPFPDAAQREAIWSRVFPARTPTQGLDSRRLAQLNVAGGNIRNIALNAAFFAAADGTGKAVAMEHIYNATRLEAEKIERPLSEAETRGWI